MLIFLIISVFIHKAIGNLYSRLGCPRTRNNIKWVEGNTKCFTYVDSPVGFKEARKRCNAMSGRYTTKQRISLFLPTTKNEFEEVMLLKTNRKLKIKQSFWLNFRVNQIKKNQFPPQVHAGNSKSPLNFPPDFKFWKPALKTSGFKTDTRQPRLIVGLNGKRVYWEYAKKGNKYAFICETEKIERHFKTHTECYQPSDATNSLPTIYNGKKSTTHSGKRCRKWNDKSKWGQADKWNINQHLVAKMDSSDHNYCRSPDGGAPWCYIYDNAEKYESCDIPRCEKAKSDFEKFQTLGKCGRRPAMESDLEKRVHGGRIAEFGEVPFMAQLVYLKGKAKTPEHICGATIISSCFVLTAAHCVEPENMRAVYNNLQIQIGTRFLETSQ